MDGSWNNSHQSLPKNRNSNSSKTLLGATIALIVLGLGVGVFIWGARNRQKVQAWENSHADADWAEARRVVGQLQNDSEALNLYRINPKLKDRFPTDQVFLATLSHWRSFLCPLPQAVPSASAGIFEHRVGVDGRVAFLKFKMENGHQVVIFWDGPSVKSSRQITDIAMR